MVDYPPKAIGILKLLPKEIINLIMKFEKNFLQQFIKMIYLILPCSLQNTECGFENGKN